MAVRTTASAVQNLLGRDWDSTTDVSIFMEAATVIVDRVVACAAAKGQDLNTVEKELVERWLSAHLYQQSDQGFTSKSTADASASYQGQTGLFLTGTKYGQTAMRIDPSGCLEAVGRDQRAVASGFWLGKPTSEQIPLDQRD